MMTIDCGPCTVRSWQYADEDNLAHHANNRAIWLNLRDRFPHPYTHNDAQQWVQFVVDQAIETDFAIDVRGEAVGAIGLRLHDDIERHSAEVWYWLGEQHWGRGIVSAALRAITDYAFTALPLIRIYALPFAHNKASVSVLEKAGYQREGVLRWSAIKDGAVLDQVMYACTSADWLAANNEFMPESTSANK